MYYQITYSLCNKHLRVSQTCDFLHQQGSSTKTCPLSADRISFELIGVKDLSREYHKCFIISKDSNPALNKTISVTPELFISVLIFDPLKVLVKDATFNTIDYSRIFPVETVPLLALFWFLMHPQSIKATGNSLFQVCHFKRQILRCMPGQPCRSVIWMRSSGSHEGEC